MTDTPIISIDNLNLPIELQEKIKNAVNIRETYVKHE